MDIDLRGEIDDMQDPDTVIGFLYSMCFEESFGEEPIHPDVEKFLSELNKYILYDSMDSNSLIKIDPVFFRDNKKLSEQIMPVLAYNIRNYSGKDIKIQCDYYTLLLTGESQINEGMVAYGNLKSPRHINTYDNAFKSAEDFLKLLSDPGLSQFSTKNICS